MVKKQKRSLSHELREIIVLLSIAFLIRTFGFGLYQVPTGSMETTMLVGERFFADKFTILFSKPKHGEIISFNDPHFGYSTNPVVNLFQQYVWGPSNVTKRVIGVPGDVVKGVIEDGKPVIYLNGKKLEESYLNKYPLIPVMLADGHPHYRSYDPNLGYDEQKFYKFDSANVRRTKKLYEQVGEPTILYPATPLPSGWGKDEFEIHLNDSQYWVMGDNRLGSADSRSWGPLDKKFIHGKIKLRLFSLDTDESWWILDLIFHPIDFWKKVRWSRCLQFVS